MLKSFSALFLFVLTFSLNAQDKEYKQYFYPNGIISSEGFLVNMKPDGIWKSYYPNGVLKTVGKRTNHILDSVWTFYNEKGDLVEKINYKDGKKNGYSTQFYIQCEKPIHRGNRKAELLYVNNHLNGVSRYFYENTILHEYISYKDGEKDGISYQYDNKGTLVTIKEYINGNLVRRDKVNRTIENYRSGKWVNLYDNFQIKEEMFYTRGKLDGVYKLFDKNGNLLELVNYENDSVVDKSELVITDMLEKVYTNDKGQKTVGTFKSNTPTGIHRVYEDKKIINTIFYSTSGIIISEGIILENGEKTGSWINYNSEGTVSSKGLYKNDKRHGKWTFYYPTGKVSQKGEYNNGNFNGDWLWLFPSGDTIRYESYNYGYEDGRFVEYDNAGNKIFEGLYIDGFKEGKWFYQVGDHTETGKYSAGVRDGKWKYFYADGTLKYEGNYVQGSPNGKHKIYYPNGIVKEEQFYVSGFKEGNWKKYDETGQLLITITYKNDKEIRINGFKITEA